jgi:hypothetical protein
MSKKSKTSYQMRQRIPDRETWEEFVEFVEDKYGISRGIAGIELDKCMKYHMAMEGWKHFPDMIEDGILVGNPKVHTHKPGKNAKTKKISAVDKLLIQTIYKNVAPGTEIYFKTLSKWITTECELGNRRTHKSHVDILVAHGVLKDLEGNYTAYEVLDPEDL